MVSAGERDRRAERTGEPVIQARLLGQFAVFVRGRLVPETAWQRRKARQLLKLLLTRPSHRLTKDEAYELLWPESDPEAAATNLRSTVHALRRALSGSGEAAGAEFLEVQRETIGLRPDLALWVDAEAFEQALAQAQSADDPLPHLEAADALYAGDLLPDDLYDDWATERREALKRTWSDLQLTLARHRERSGDLDRALAALHRLLQADPCDERAARRLIRVLARHGRRVEALRVYQRLVQALRQELEAEPSQATVELGQQLTAAPSSEPPEPVARAVKPPAEPGPTGVLGGTVTLLFSDIEGSTRLLRTLGDDYATLLGQHHHLLRAAFQAHGGQELGVQGDGFFVAFRRAADAVAAAVEAQRVLADQAWPAGAEVRVRLALHTGEPTHTAGTYVGLDIHRVARLCAAAHGGQVLLSQTTHDLVEHELPAGSGLRDLGEHWLKDLPLPERIFQLTIPNLPTDFPPPRAVASRVHNLPLQRTALIGRESEIAAVRALLLRDDVGLVTLSGPAGTGKTRLAIGAASSLVDRFRDGVYFVALAPILEPELVVSAIVRTLGLHEVGGTSLEEILKSYLRDKQLLLVLDNFEQLLAAAPLVGDLLAGCPRLKILVTSRAILQLYGEQDFQVPPLALPEHPDAVPSEQLVQFSAIALFLERAMAVNSDFRVTAGNRQAVAELCRRLDGLPLAIELAAARVRVLPPPAMLARLERRLPLLTSGPRDLPARQQTLRGAIGWSYDLLTSAEQALFRRLAVFVGGWTLPAAEAVCAVGVPSPDEVLDRLTSLVSQSLVQQRPEVASGEPRFSMLETIREYGLEQLEANGELDRTRRRHAEYFLQLAQQGERRIGGPEQAAWIARLDEEQPNFRAALTWSLLEGGDRELGQRLPAALWVFWFRRGYLSEGSRWLQQALAAFDDDQSPLRATLLTAAGSIARMAGDFAAAERLLEAGATLHRRLGDTEGVAWALSHLGLVKQWQGFLDLGVEMLEQSLSLRRPLGNQRDIARSLFNLGLAEDFRSNYARAAQRYEEALEAQRQVGDTWGMGRVFAYLGQVALRQGDQQRATSLCEEGLPLSRQVGDNWGIALALEGLGRAAAARQDFLQAAELLTEALTMFRDVGSRDRLAECLQDLASLAMVQGRAERAACLLAAAESTQQSIGLAFWPAVLTRREQDLAQARSALGEADFARAWSDGLAMSIEQAIDYALAGSSPESDERVERPPGGESRAG